ncbi:hypothetical protein [Erythrobacter sp.]|uniref:hypothetical protein n=1 Tax=Erythrobacter sp. TaxID=1042 RepID=UPI0025C3673F|nr:hypothetical protein [Erythrobacter sp.]
MTGRSHGGGVWFTAHAEMEIAVGRDTWSGGFLLTDLWRKSGLRRRWKLAERSLAPVEANEALSHAIRALQLWR